MTYRAIAFIAALGAAGPAGAQIVSVTPQVLPRHFGYFVGDVITGTSVISVGPGVMLDENSLPAPGPAATSIDIRSLETRMSGPVAGPHRYTVAVTYQNFFAPDRAVKIDVPGYTLGFMAAGRHLTAQVAGFSFTASPFRDDIQPVLDPSVLAPDRAGVAADESRPKWLLGAGVAMTAVAALGLLMERLPIAGVYRRRAPFAAAARRIARLSSSSQPATADALLSLHAAFDATVGRRVFADDLDRFFNEYSQFAPFRAETEQFFRLSRAAFFGAGNMPADLSLAKLKTLSRDLMRAERLP